MGRSSERWKRHRGLLLPFPLIWTIGIDGEKDSREGGRERGRKGRKEITEERARQAFHTIMLRDASRMLRWQPLILRKAQSARLMRWHRAWIAPWRAGMEEGFAGVIGWVGERGV